MGAASENATPMKLDQPELGVSAAAGATAAVAGISDQDSIARLGFSTETVAAFQMSREYSQKKNKQEEQVKNEPSSSLLDGRVG